jgi:hypothetical protein
VRTLFALIFVSFLDVSRVCDIDHYLLDFHMGCEMALLPITKAAIFNTPLSYNTIIYIFVYFDTSYTPSLASIGIS